MCDADGEICQSVTQQAVQTTPAKPKQTTGVTQTDVHFNELHKLFAVQASQQNTTAPQNSAPDLLQIAHWQLDEVQQWVGALERFSEDLLECLRCEAIDGQVLLALTEEDVRDMRLKLGYKLTFGELKKFWLSVFHLQLQWKHEEQQHLQQQQLQQHQLNGFPVFPVDSSAPLMLDITGHLAQAPLTSRCNTFMPISLAAEPCPCPSVQEGSSSNSDGDAARGKDRRSVAPEYFKTAISLGYSFVVTWITSFVMVIVHERVPDMKRYPPLPDIFLDNVPHIPWAFNMCEITGSLLFTVWLIVLIFHKYRMVLLRRFFALAGTVFLLRCVTMLITSLSVPGTHLQCNQKDFAIDDPNVDVFGALVIRMTRAYRIWSGLGMSIQGVRTCGDYMFSGHTVALTLLNFFITEYTPRNLYFLHTMTWLLNMFGIFFILAAHEHYSIDVFVAFYITSRLFLYYHTLANNRALMQSDSTRTRIWFPMFSYFESTVDGIIPNEFDTAGTLFDSMLQQIYRIKEHLTELTYRVWADLTGSSNETSIAGSTFISASHSLVANINNLRTTVTNAATAMTKPASTTKVPPASTAKALPLGTPTAVTAAASQQLKHTGIDSSSSPYARVIAGDLRTPLTEKKVL